MSEDRYPVCLASELDANVAEQRWLIEDLWAQQAVGILGGEPKCCKSFCALDIAVSVASGVPCLGRFSPATKGTVLLYAAEDALHVVRRRLEGICRIEGVDFSSLDVHVITAPSVRLDIEASRARLDRTITEVMPHLLILDPFVRLHRVDENAVAEVAPLLAYLRELQRIFECSVLLVHHARKGAGGARGGQALRGSSELHAIGDSNLYLRRKGDELLLSIEHRAAPSVDDIPVGLTTDGDDVALRVKEDQPTTAPTTVDLHTRVVAALESSGPMTPRQLRAACRVRMARVYEVLGGLVETNRVLHDGSVYRAA